MNDRQSWAEYRAEHGITPEEEPAAFAAYLNLLSGGRWDEDAVEKDPADDD
ncbi:hypothetical protein [Agromyces humi]|uniref:hypothetical protein n=1 Tax=Agromyces humi TaxID=1766800 RepID=UPI001358F3F4|nr:hypothetical protein [Agromyces humi]